MTDPLQTLRRLRALADNDAATPEERATARRIAVAIAARYGVDAAAIDDPHHEVDLPARGEGQRQLLVRIAAWLGLQAWNLSSVGRDGRRRRIAQLRVEGPRSLVLEVEALYKVHRQRQKRIAEAAAQGYAVGAFTLPDSDDDSDDRSSAAPTLDELEAMVAGYGAGSRHRERRSGDTHLLTDRGDT